MKFPLFWGQDSDLHLLHRSCFPSPQTHVSLRPLIRPCPMKSRPGLSPLGHRGRLLAVPTGRQRLRTRFGSRELCCQPCLGIPASLLLPGGRHAPERGRECVWGDALRGNGDWCGATAGGRETGKPSRQRAVPETTEGGHAAKGCAVTSQREQAPELSHEPLEVPARLLRCLLGLGARHPPHCLALSTAPSPLPTLILCPSKAWGHIPHLPKSGSQTG